MRKEHWPVLRVLLGFSLLGPTLMSGNAAAQAPAGSAPSAASAQPAQYDVRNPPPGTIVSPGTVTAPRSTLPAGAVPATAPVGETCDYWIVSSRNCSGRASTSNDGCVDFFHRTSERDVANVGREAFMASIRPDVPICFVVHGSYNWWRDVVTESRRINRWVRSADPGAPVQVVFFTWPSDGNMPYLFPVDIAVLGRKASQHSVYLANLIGQLPPEQPVSVLGHSHGARASVAALHLLGGGALEDGQRLPPGHSTPRRLRAVLVAAAIDHNWLNPGQRYGQALLVPEQVLLMRNSRDATLAIYPLRKGWGERAIGRDGLALGDRFAMDQMGRKVVELDAAQFAGTNHSFANYHENAELAAAIVPYIHFRVDGVRSGDYEPAVPITPPKESPRLGEPEPIRPAGRTPANDGSTPVGPKLTLTPASLAPSANEETPPAREEPRSSGGRIMKILPKSRSAAREPASSEPPTVEPGPLQTSKKRNPFQLRLEQ